MVNVKFGSQKINCQLLKAKKIRTAMKNIATKISSG